MVDVLVRITFLIFHISPLTINVSHCILIYISNKMQHYTVYFVWKLPYMFRVLPLPIIRSANNCIYNGVTNTRCCRYNCFRS